MPSYEVFRMEQAQNFIFLLKFYILAVAFILITVYATYIILKQLNIFWLKIRCTKFYHRLHRQIMKGAKR